MKQQFINRTLYFPEKGILAIGDLHLGYEEQLRQSGVLVPERQVKDLIEDLKYIFKKIKSQDNEVRKIIFLGDIKHFFSYNYREQSEFRKVIDFLGEFLPPENIIILKGNHDTVDYSFESIMKDYYVAYSTAFIHGHKDFPEIWKPEIKTIIMGHIHPSVILSEEQGIKKEKYKCFLKGMYKRKEIIILPSFLDFKEGQPINDYEEYEDRFSIIPRKSLKDFRVFVVGEDKVYEFGKVKEI